MKNSILMGALVLAMALLPSFASAGSFAYDVPIGQMEDYLVTGSNPTLQQSTGSAEIDHVDDLGLGVLRVWVECFSTSSVDCTGNIVTT